jgi:hypothetical protein
VAPLTAVQLSVAPELVMAEAVKPVGAPQATVPVVVNCALE